MEKKQKVEKIDFTDVTYEVARDKLAKYIRTLEEGTSSLDETLQIWNEAKQYVDFCKDFLEKASKSIEETE